jgi:hypothetical protein
VYWPALAALGPDPRVQEPLHLIGTGASRC